MRIPEESVGQRPSGGTDALDDGTVRTFETLFATNHKFYGLADLFLNIPRDTGGRGLRDLVLQWKLAGPAGTSVAVDLHAFRLGEAKELGTARLAEEVDVTLDYGFNSALRLTGGFSQVWRRLGLAEIGRDTRAAHVDEAWSSDSSARRDFPHSPPPVFPHCFGDAPCLSSVTDL